MNESFFVKLKDVLYINFIVTAITLLINRYNFINLFKLCTFIFSILLLFFRYIHGFFCGNLLNKILFLWAFEQVKFLCWKSFKETKIKRNYRIQGLMDTQVVQNILAKMQKYLSNHREMQSCISIEKYNIFAVF